MDNAQIQSPTIDRQPVTGLAAHPRPDFRSVQSEKVGRTNSNRELPAVQPITGNATVGPGSFFSRHLFELLYRLCWFCMVEKLM